MTETVAPALDISRLSEITLAVTAPYANRAVAEGAGSRLARILVGRCAR